MNFSTPAPARQAALTLHALPQSDRNWLLDALEPEDREQLNQLLEELRTLGIPGDSGLVAELAKAEVPAASPRDWLGALDAVGASALATVLRPQPVEFARAVLSLAAGTPQAGPPMAPALARAIRTTLEPHWKKAMAEQTMVKAPSRWDAWSARIRRLGSGR